MALVAQGQLAGCAAVKHSPGGGWVGRWVGEDKWISVTKETRDVGMWGGEWWPTIDVERHGMKTRA